jgi:DNA-binding winged helix-turn-helix (wHTH) protein
MSLRFGNCTLDIGARRLFRGRDEVRLSPKAFETLRVLVENRPRAMSKRELLESVWLGIVVSEVSLARVVSEIRSLLQGKRSGRIIRTVHSHGYAFVAEIDSGAGKEPALIRKAPVCWLISESRSLPLREGSHIVGRDPALDVFLDSPKVSRRHARIDIAGTRATIEDLGSKNGSVVGKTRIEFPTTLCHGDEVQFGRFRFVFRLTESLPSTESDI